MASLLPISFHEKTLSAISNILYNLCDPSLTITPNSSLQLRISEDVPVMEDREKVTKCVLYSSSSIDNNGSV
jgi:hypothetical protein